MVKNLPANTGALGSIPGSERSPGLGNGNSLQHSCLGNYMNRGAWWATVQGVPKSGIRLSKHVYPLINAALLSVFEPGTASTPLIRTNPLAVLVPDGMRAVLSGNCYTVPRQV